MWNYSNCVSWALATIPSWSKCNPFMSPVESLLAYLVARRHPGCRGQAEDTGRRQKKPGQELRNSQGNQLQLAARTVTETETEICQTARTIKTGPRAVDLISALPLIPLFLLLYPNVFIFLLFFFSPFCGRLRDGWKCHTRKVLWVCSFAVSVSVFLLFWQQRKTCTLHLPQSSTTIELTNGSLNPKGKKCNFSNATVAAAAIYFIIIAHEHNGKKITWNGPWSLFFIYGHLARPLDLSRHL